MTYKTIEEMYAASLAEASTGQQPEAQAEQPLDAIPARLAASDPSFIGPASKKRLKQEAVALWNDAFADVGIGDVECFVGMVMPEWADAICEAMRYAENLTIAPGCKCRERDGQPCAFWQMDCKLCPPCQSASPAEQPAPAQTPLQAVQAAEVGDVAICEDAEHRFLAIRWPGSWRDPGGKIIDVADMAYYATHIIPASALEQYRIGGNSEQ